MTPRRPADRDLLTFVVQVESLLGVIRTNTELEDQGRPVKELCLNKVFLGNPGTGNPRMG